MPESTLIPRNKVFNFAARLVSRSPLYHHITTYIISMHWLPIKYRIMLKISVNMFKLKNCIYPEYLKSLIVQPHRSNLRSSTLHTIIISSPQLTTLLQNVHFLMLVHIFGILYLLI